MKPFAVVFFLVFASSALNAQGPANTQDSASAEIVKFSWSKERRNWEQNPFGGPNENFHEMQFRSRSEKRVSDAKHSSSPELNKLEKEARADVAIIEAERQRKGPPRYVFLYKLVVKNNAAKAIKEVDWDYIFRDAATGEELGRREFSSVQNIGPGKSKELQFTLGRPPSQRISVYSLDRKERQGLLEEVVIVRILYTDGSVWQIPQ